MTSVVTVVRKFLTEYEVQTPKRLKAIDAYLAYVLLTGIVQFVYCCLVGTFPFNSFLSGFISSVGCFILAGIISPFVFAFKSIRKTKFCSVKSAKKEPLPTSS